MALPVLLPGAKLESSFLFLNTWVDLRSKLEDVVDRIIAKSNGTGRILVVVGQFEELFTPAGTELRAGFSRVLLKAAEKSNSRGPQRFLGARCLGEEFRPAPLSTFTFRADWEVRATLRPHPCGADFSLRESFGQLRSSLLPSKFHRLALPLFEPAPMGIS